MSRTLQLIRDLSATSSRNEKQALLQAAFEDGERDFFIGARLALDPLTTFGVAKVALIEEDDGFEGELTFAAFLDLTAKLARRDLTGHAARDAINEAASICHVATWNEFYRRILLKDLKVGVEAKGLNSALEKVAKGDPSANDFLVPVFGLQLALDGADPAHAKKIKGVKLVDYKLDGIRLLTFLDKSGTVRQFTRGGNENENFGAIRESLKSLMADLPVSVVLDGEMVGQSFRDLMTQVQRKENVETSDLRLALFDILPLDDYRRGGSTITQRDRHAALVELVTCGLLQQHCGDKVYVVPKTEIDLDTAEGQAQFEEVNRMAIASGYEGIMIKDPDGPYELRKWATWLKKKPTISVSLEIVGFEEGDADSKYAGTLGALICRGEDDGKMIEVNVGSGLSDADRDHVWSKRDDYLGYIVEITADALTQSRGSEVWSLRFPRFKGFRGTAKGEKI